MDSTYSIVENISKRLVIYQTVDKYSPPPPNVATYELLFRGEEVEKRMRKQQGR